MTYYGAKELAAAFRTVRKNTIQIAEDIPEDKYNFRSSSDTRTIGETLAHIAIGTEFAQHIHGNKIDDLSKVDFSELSKRISAEEGKSRSKAEIVALLKSQGEKFASYLEVVPESFLSERVKMPSGSDPTTKSRFEMLLSPKEHEMHHRGQLMTLERLVGLVPHLTRQRQQRMTQPAATR